MNLIVEVTGEARQDTAAKVTTARTLRVPAVKGAWSTLYGTVSRPFAPPETGKSRST